MLRLIHLSDMHFGGGRSRLMNRVNKLARVGTMQLPDEVVAIALLFNGDFTEKGQPAQFAKAQEFIEGLYAQIKLNAKNRSIHCFLTPGNHDCDFSEDQVLRDLALQHLKPERPTQSLEDAALGPLKNFWLFQKELKVPISSSLSKDSPYVSSFELCVS